MNTLETERHTPDYEYGDVRAISAAQQNQPLPVAITFTEKQPLPDGKLACASFKLELGPSGRWMLYSRASSKDDWFKITDESAAVTEHRFSEKWPLQNGELALSNFKLEADSFGGWVLYKQAYWEQHWLRITADIAVGAVELLRRLGVSTIAAKTENTR